MTGKFYVTTPIYYVNDSPHIGHAVTTVVADIIARYQKLKGKKVFFLTGTDEHGAKVAEAAKKENCSPQEFCDTVSKTFADIWPKLNIGFDYFIRTTNKEHEKTVSSLLEKIYKNGDIYKDKYEGKYCVGCEKFVTESDLVNECCPLHPGKLIEKQSETNWFFRLSKYVPFLIEAIENPKSPNYYEILPESKKSEVLTRLKAGVNDISISRFEVPWGIPVPWDNTQTIYVWVDALINYYSALEINHNQEFWPAEIHLIGKEILWFHAVIWEALLLSAGISLPKTIYAHAFYTIDKQKMSKSLGNVITPQQLLERFGVDGTRYLLASSFPSLEDSDVGNERFLKKYNSDLANGLGNLVARITKLCETSGFVFKETREIKYDEKIGRLIENYRIEEALFAIWDKINKTNKEINENKIWEQKGEDLRKSLQSCVDSILKIAECLKPFMPETAEKIALHFKETKIKSAGPLFPRI